jgi:hypothetical protein
MQEGERLMRRTFRRIVLFLSAFFPAFAVLLGTVGNWRHKSYFLALFAAVILLTLISIVCRKELSLYEMIERRNPIHVCLLMSVVCLLLNGAWVLMFHPIQAPDYQTFFQAALDLANGRSLSGKDYLAMFPHILGYAAFLSVFLRLFGESLMTAALVNVVLTTLSGVLLYALSLKFCGRKSAFMAFMFWMICPSKMLYNAMSLSEPFYTCLLLLFFLLAAETMEIRQTGGWERKVVAAGLLSGLTLGLVNAARPIGIIPIIAFFVWLLFLSDWKTVLTRKKTVMLFSCLFLLAYIATGRIWNSYATEKLEQTPPSVPGYSIYVGFNPRTQGSYADEDMDLLQSRYFGEFGRNAEAAQRSMLESAKTRITENRNNIPGLMIHKLGTLLGHDEGGAFYSKDGLSDRAYSLWCIVSNIWYYLVCLLAVAGCLKMWKNPPGNSFMVIPLCLIGIVLAQLLVEVAARYHYCLIPMLLLLASPALKKRHPPV